MACGEGRNLRTKLYLAAFFVAFAVLSAIMQIVLALWPAQDFNRWLSLLVLVLGCAAWAAFSVRPKSQVLRDFGRFSVRVVVADIFEQESHLVIGFTDTFDTDTSGGRIISPRSLQGQLLQRMYGGDVERLDADIQEALGSTRSIGVESQSSKLYGKRVRYPVGSVSVISKEGRCIFCVAYSEMGNDLVAKSNVNLLWRSLSSLWDAVSLRGQCDPVAIPIIGSELSRVGALDRNSLAKMIILSFVARARQEYFCKELILVVRESDRGDVDMFDIQSFLRSI